MGDDGRREIGTDTLVTRAITKIYTARGSFHQQERVWVEEKLSDNLGRLYPLKHNTYHSPDGHSWGYGGSGPAELAKDILWDFLGERPKGDVYQMFKFDMIASLPMNSGFTITEEQIREWIENNFPDENLAENDSH